MFVIVKPVQQTWSNVRRGSLEDTFTKKSSLKREKISAEQIDEFFETWNVDGGTKKLETNQKMKQSTIFIHTKTPRAQKKLIKTKIKMADKNSCLFYF